MTYPRAERALERLLAGIDRCAPDASVWILGSLALGDFVPSRSDVDLVIVGVQPIPDLARAPLDVTWLATVDELATRPLGAVTAAMLHRHGVALRGPDPAGVVADVDHATLAAAMIANLDAYWEPWLTRARRTLGRIAALHPRRVEWGVFGVPRMLVTLGDGRIVSKTEGALALRDRVDPPWRRIIDEALRIRGQRRGSSYRSPFERARDMLAFVAHAIDLARRVRLPRGGVVHTPPP
ncbi:MAG TPA: nucleotidyltransferase domain-containing protein [Kofleriaceae bacterium]|nr:nucleotidyltransferase domain-containing protein [Kofleriaceae bacterium]